jgi:hypothetical protein
MRPALHLRTAGDIRTLREATIVRRRPSVAIDVPGIPADRRLYWELELNSALRECGCSLGARGVLLAAVASLVYQFGWSSLQPSYWPGFLVRKLAGMFVAGAIGKIVGLERANAKVRRIAGEVLDVLEDTSMEKDQHVHLHEVGR